MRNSRQKRTIRIDDQARISLHEPAARFGNKHEVVFKRPAMNRHDSLFITSLVCLFCSMVFSSGVGAENQPRQFSLKAESPKFWELVDQRAQLNRVATGFGFTEGPVWDERGFLYVSDEEQNKIFKVYTNGRKEELISLGDPDGNTYDRKGRLIDCASVLRAIINITPDGKYTILADKFEGKKFNSPNDVTIGPDGAIYFTDPTLDLVKGEQQELSFQGVYHLDEKGEVRLLTKDLTQPNGLAFSPDGKHFYVDDSQQRNIRVYDVNADGSLGNGRVFGTEPGGAHDGVPDGIRVDESGNLYVTGPKGIWVWDPEGHHIGTIEMPEQPSNLTWGDPDYRTLYITATSSVYKLRTKIRGHVPTSVVPTTAAASRN
jgi:gluconolactonase